MNSSASTTNVLLFFSRHASNCVANARKALDLKFQPFVFNNNKVQRNYTGLQFEGNQHEKIGFPFVLEQNTKQMIKISGDNQHVQHCFTK